MSAMLSRKLRLATIACLALTPATGCLQWRPKGPDLDRIYVHAATNPRADRNPVIVIPGMMGSTLSDPDGNSVWGTFVRRNVKPKEPAGARLVALPMREGASLHELIDELRPDGVLKRLRMNVLGLPLHLGAYYRLIEMLEYGGYRHEGLERSGTESADGPYTSFQFAYDWRLDLSRTAKLLAEFVEEKREYVLAERERRYGIADPDVKFDIVAHSMGGLLTRYYLRYGGEPLPDDGSVPPPTWSGARNVERAILVAPPNAGSIQTILNLVEGVKFGPTLPRYEPAILGTWPGAYQILPRGRHLAVVDASDPGRHFEDLFDPALWERLGWGLAATDQDHVLRWLLPDLPDSAARRRVALDHLAKVLARARQFCAALDVPARPPRDLAIHLMAGDAVPTPAVIAVDPATGKIDVVEKRSGDGRVLRSSALMDERLAGSASTGLVSPIDWTDVNFFHSGHLAMTKDSTFADNVLFILLEQ